MSTQINTEKQKLIFFDLTFIDFQTEWVSFKKQIFKNCTYQKMSITKKHCPVCLKGRKNETKQIFSITDFCAKIQSHLTRKIDYLFFRSV